MEHRTTPKTLNLRLKTKFRNVLVRIAKPGSRCLLSSFHTEHYITEGVSQSVYRKYELGAKPFLTQTTLDTAYDCNDVFIPPPEHEQSIRTVLTKGIAGTGKTVSVRKFITSWAEGKANQDIHFIFLLPFQELNLVKDRKYSLLGLINYFYPEMKECYGTDLWSHKILIIFDGLNESRLALNFQNNENWMDVTEPTSVDVLLTNLIKGNLLPSALLWITSRPAAANQIPSELVQRVTEVRGFNDAQIEVFFKKSIQDQSLASRVISHIKSFRSLHIMCHIPMFCWISGTVLEIVLGKAEEKSGKIPKTLTELYTHFLLIQTNLKHQGMTETSSENLLVSDSETILKLGELAFENLEKGNFLFTEEDVRSFGIDVRAASVLSEVRTETSREDSMMCQSRVFRFIHLSIQEYLAALHVYFSFRNNGRNVLDQTCSAVGSCRKVMLIDLHKAAVDQALQSQTGHLDLFLRFLVGLSLDSSQSHFQVLLTRAGNRSHNTEETVQYIKERIRKSLSPKRTIGLLHCLNELKDISVREEIQTFLTAEVQGELHASDWSDLVFALLTSEDDLDEFEMKLYSRSQYGPLIMLPVVQFAKQIVLWDSNITESCCEVLASALTSSYNELRVLDLSGNEFQDSGVKLICAGLENPYCKVEKLKLRWCNLTEKCCDALACTVGSDPHLRELELDCNHLQDSGLKLLSAGLCSPLCKLEILSLDQCELGEESCGVLASVLNSDSSSLRDLCLSYNDLHDSGINLLCTALQNPDCKLERLRMDRCRLTEKCCDALACALRSNPHLKKLDLCNNDLLDSGVELICAGLQSPLCELEELGVWGCELTEDCCAVLAAALSSSSSHLRELDLSHNDLQDAGVRLLSPGLNDPNCGLEKLVLIRCGLTDKCCEALASALSSNCSHLRKLDLTSNELRDSGVKLICAALENPHCKLEKLELQGCALTEKCCDVLASALSSEFTHLRKLDVGANDLQDSGVKLLCAGLENPHCKLEKLMLQGCGVTNASCASLASALRSNPWHLRVLDLSLNGLQDSGDMPLSALLKDPLCKLKTLRI